MATREGVEEPSPEPVLSNWANSVIFRGASRTSCGPRARRGRGDAPGEGADRLPGSPVVAGDRDGPSEEAGMEAGTREGSASTVRSSASRPSGLRVALVHDWLTGMRGGEKCLEVLCRAFPDATLHTLIHRKGSLSPAIEAMAIRTSPLQRIPGVLRHYRHLLPLMPLAARSWRPGEVDLVVSLSHCVAKAVRPPAGVPHVCYCFTPMRYAWDGRDAYLDAWSSRPVRRALAGAAARPAPRLGPGDRRAGHALRGDLGDGPASGSPGATAATAGSSRRRSTPTSTRPTPGPATAPISASRPWCPTSGSSRRCWPARASGRPLVVIGEGPERARLEAMAGPSVRFLGWQPDEVIRDHYRRCRALLFPGEEDFGIVPVEALACGAR